MAKIERRESSLPWVQKIDLFSISRAVVQRFGVGVSGQKFQTGETLSPTQLQRIVARFSAGNEIAIAAEVLAERSAGANLAASHGMECSCFTVGSADPAIRNLLGLADAEADGRIAGVRLEGREQMMPLGSNIARLDQSGLAQLSFDRQLILLRIGQNISVPEGGRGADRQEIRPIDFGIGRR